MNRLLLCFTLALFSSTAIVQATLPTNQPTPNSPKTKQPAITHMPGYHILVKNIVVPQTDKYKDFSETTIINPNYSSKEE